MFFLFLKENISCDPFLEPSQRDGSNDGSQHNLVTPSSGKGHNIRFTSTEIP